MSAAPRPFPHVVCVGLDGATFDVIDPMVASGRLPVLARLLERGTRSLLASTVPPLSAPAWVSFMTGENPGKHGIWHFRELEPTGLGASLVGSWIHRGRTIFDHASRAGLRSVSFRVPLTYPAWSINGVMVAGFPTPDPLTTYSEPPEVGERIGPLLKLSSVRSLVAGVAEQAANFDHYLERSTPAIVDLLRREQPELFCYVNSITDWIAHKFWRHSDPAAPGYDPLPTPDGRTLLESFYEKCDAQLGAILDAAPPDALVVVLSDHGTGRRSTRRFATNAWLGDLGVLTRAKGRLSRRAASAAIEWAKDVLPKKYWLWRKAPRSVRAGAEALRAYGGAVDWSRTEAYRVALDHHVDGVNVNLRGREPHGVVTSERYEAVRERVIRAAAEVRDPRTGQPVIEAAHRREDLYSGDKAHLAPDVVLVLDPAYEAGRGAERQVFSEVAPSRLGRSSATHRPDGILVMAGPGVRAGEDLGRAGLLDVPPTILWALGLDIPDRMDGRVLEEAFSQELRRGHPVRRVAEGAPDAAAASAAYSEEEEQQLAAHLSELGYL